MLFETLDSRSMFSVAATPNPVPIGPSVSKQAVRENLNQLDHAVATVAEARAPTTIATARVFSAEMISDVHSVQFD